MGTVTRERGRAMATVELIVLGLLFGVLAALAVHRSLATRPVPGVVSEHAIREVVYRHPRVQRFFASRFDPAGATVVALSTAGVLFVIGATIIGVLAAMARSSTGLAQVDPRIARWAATHVGASSVSFLRTVTQFGGAVVIVPLAAVVAVLEAVRAKSRSVLLFMLLVVGGQFLVANSIKFVVDRARPALHPLTGFSGRSFPSGHATAAAATFAAFAFLLGRRRSTMTRSLLTGSAVAIAVIIAGTRVLLGVHWFSDVVAGLLLGWAWFAVCCFAFGGRLLRFGLPVVQAEAAAQVVEVAAGAASPGP